jgi:CheY-like chemotaxis protein
VIDDSPPMRQALRAVLTLKGYRAQTAENGADGLAAVDTNPPDVILLDLMMPGMSGLEFLRVLRQHPRSGSLPAAGDRRDRERLAGRRGTRAGGE